METMDLALRTYFVPDELEALLKFIPSPQLLKFRQVSKELDEVAEIVLRKRRDIKLLLTTDNFDSRTNWEFLQFLNDAPENVFVAPVLHVKNTNKWDLDLEEGKTCNSFQIIGEICKRLGNRGIIRKLIIEDGDNAPHFTSDFLLVLLNHLSSGISELQLSLWAYTSLATSEQINTKFQMMSLSLKQINFGCAFGFDVITRFRMQTSPRIPDVNEAGNLLKIILESSPNLENFDVSYSDLRKLNLIAMLKDTRRLSKMKGVAFTKSADLDILLQCQPKIVLESLKIDANDAIDSTKLYTFLQQQAKSLKIFEYHVNHLILNSVFTLPVLPVLQKLNFNSRNSGCLLSVNYGRQTPVLKYLGISSADNFQSWEEFLFYKISREMTPCFSLEEMDLQLEGQASQKVFDNWKNLFPNLKKLIFDNAWQFEIEQINKCWPNLEQLQLNILTGYSSYPYDCKHKDLDEIAFGISPYWKGKIDTTEKDWWMKIPAPEIKTSVANLKSLKKLTIHGFGCAGKFTDFAIYFGLRHMENLKELVITSGPGMRDEPGGVSTEAFNFLVKNLPKLEKLNLGKQKWERGETLE